MHRSMEEAFATFKKIIEGQGLTLEQLGFRPGASATEIKELESEIGRELPHGLRYFLSQVNGQTEDGLLFLPGCACARLLSCEEIAKTWHFGKQLAAREGAMDFFDRYQDDDRIRGILHSEDWIVFAEEAGIVVVALDFVPGPNGTSGQVITDITECDFIVLGESFDAYFSKIVSLMESGVLAIRYSDDYESHILGQSGELDLVDAEVFVGLPI